MVPLCYRKGEAYCPCILYSQNRLLYCSVFHAFLAWLRARSARLELSSSPNFVALSWIFAMLFSLPFHLHSTLPRHPIPREILASGPDARSVLSALQLRHGETRDLRSWRQHAASRRLLGKREVAQAIERITTPGHGCSRNM